METRKHKEALYKLDPQLLPTTKEEQKSENVPGKLKGDDSRSQRLKRLPVMRVGIVDALPKLGESEVGKATCYAFREAGKTTVWIIPAGPFDTTKDIRSAMLEIKNKSYKGIKFSVYPITEKNLATGRFVVVWEQEAEFPGKQIKVRSVLAILI
ncbi:hypothetical protein FDENT_5932 [Fusarium denticulatum]|uniref:Uncharacterized protein n=1 Tax=Fusarium denticulatum TaxID=48507 RepID=A0A8H5U8Z6_9HYPO|nr:hypothetical protein FDENT_5932 [Fusarium denticulatum]